MRGSKPQSVLHHVFKALDVLLWTLQINEKQETQALPSRACNLLREAVLRRWELEDSLEQALSA